MEAQIQLFLTVAHV